MTMQGFRRFMTVLLLACTVVAAAATPESILLAGLQAKYGETQQRCELIAARVEGIDRQLSLYREELAGLRVLADGKLIAETATGALQLVAVESRAIGPASATFTLDQRYAISLEQLQAGQRIEISFIDRAGRTHQLFCGIAAVVRASPATRRTDVVALIPRAGGELQASALYQNQTCVDVLSGLAQQAGLAVQTTDQRPRTVFPQIRRNSLATWPFMLQLARQCRLDLALGGDGKLVVVDASFAPPPPPPARAWSNMTWVDVAKNLAQGAGRAPDFRLTGAYPTTNFLQNATDEDFLLQLSIAARASAWFTPGKLVLAEDGAWSSGSVRRAVPAGAPDLLLKRVVVTGAAAATRTFHRRISDPGAQALDPERVPTEEATLLLGRSMPAAALPTFALTDNRQVAAALEATLVRLGSQPVTAEQRFLQDLARHYRPTLHYLYRLLPDGTRTLDSIGR